MIANNIIADNVAGWDGAGISLVDAFNVNIINNTVVSNSTTASAGGTNCIQAGAETSCPQPAGIVTIKNSAVMPPNLH